MSEQPAGREPSALRSTAVPAPDARAHVTSGGARSGSLRALARRSGVRYLAVGASAFLVDLGLLAVLHEVLGLPVWLASGLGFLGSFAYTYSMQRLAFRADTPHGGALVRYLVLVLVNTVATAGIVHGLSTTWLDWAGGKVVATAVTTVWNYFAYRYWVFRPDRPGTAATPEGN